MRGGRPARLDRRHRRGGAFSSAGLRRCAGTLLVGLLLAAGAAAEGPVGPLFDEDRALRLRLEAPLRELIAGGEEAPEVEGSITLAGGHAIPVRLSTYGKSRLLFCWLAPLVLTPEPAAVRGTLFEGHQPLRIVPHCGNRSGSGRWAVLEYLVYRAYQIFSDTALRVRLAEIEYDDPGSGRAPPPAYGFFVEDIDSAARRRGLEWLEITRQSLADLDPREVTVLALFQHMIGNTDWSVLRGPEGERCCHNLAVLGRRGSTERRLLPFDFDNSGLVDAPYAVPSDLLPVRDVRQRFYRGFCPHNEHLPAAIELFQQRRARVETLFSDPALPYPEARRKARAYLDSFYELIAEPKKVRKRLIARCRGTGS